MRKAIAIAYAVEQNEPSVPFSRLVDVPEDATELEAVLRNLMLEYVCDDEDIVSTYTLNFDPPYGNISYGDEDLFIFLTYVEE